MYKRQLLLGFADVVLPGDLVKSPLDPGELATLVVTVAAGAAIALALGRRLPDLRAGAALAAIGSPIRRATVAVGLLVERLDFALRHWHVAGLSLVVLTLLFAAAMSGAR